MVQLMLSGCKKELSLSKGNLDFSKDTVVFDTVFTTIGSTTEQFKIYNKANKPVKIEEIELVGGSDSPFRINVDGISGLNFSDIELGSKDSLFVFVEVTLNANGQINPLIIEDSIRFRTNGKDQYVNLAVWGQDAYFHYKDLNEGTWPNDKPHVIYGYAGVDTDKTLNIQPDTKIYLHKNSLLYIYESTLHVNGTLGHEVIFQGDRLESFYKDVAGQYYGIYFERAKSSTINYAVIKNGTAGIHVYDNNAANTDYTVTVTNTKVFNHASYGLFIFAGGRLKAENCVVSKNGSHALLLLQGGDFNINQCNLLGYNSGSNQTPAVGIRNYYTDNQTNTTTIGHVSEGKIYNSVIYGNQTSEVVFDTLNPNNSVTLNFDFQRCLIKKEEIENVPFYQNIVWNSNPLFIDVSKYDYHFFSNSPLNGNTNPSGINPPQVSLFTNDIEGNERNAPTDLGAYRRN